VKALGAAAFDTRRLALSACPNKRLQAILGTKRRWSAGMLSSTISFASFRTSGEASLIWPVSNGGRGPYSTKLDRLGPLAACDLGVQPKHQIDAGRHAGGGHDLS